MKKLITFFFTIFLMTGLHAQEKEFEDFRLELNSYIDFTLGKKPEFAINQANHDKFKKMVDDAFKKFVLHKDSFQYDKLKVSRDNPNLKLVRDGRIEVCVTTFLVNDKIYVVYNYTSYSKDNYFIKNNESNTIVHDGNSKRIIINNFYFLDDINLLLIEETGDYYSSRKATVLSTKTQPWKIIKGFEGMAFGQGPGSYYEKKYVKKRESFVLKCEMSFTRIAKDINTILFDSKTKTLSYMQYYDGKKSKIIQAKWENEIFKIDDYNVNDNLSDDSPAVPR